MTEKKINIYDRIKKCIHLASTCEERGRLTNFAFYNKLWDIVDDEFSEIKDEERRNTILIRVMDSYERANAID